MLTIHISISHWEQPKSTCSQLCLNAIFWVFNSSVVEFLISADWLTPYCFVTDRGSQWTPLLVPVLLLESFCHTPPPPINTPHPPYPTTPAPILRQLLITPPPLFHTSTPPSPSASSPPLPSCAPLDLGPPAPPSPQRPRPRSPSARLRLQASVMCHLPAMSHTHTYSPSQSGENKIWFWNLKL